MAATARPVTGKDLAMGYMHNDLDWSELLLILKAAKKFRICGSIQEAKDAINQGLKSKEAFACYDGFPQFLKKHASVNTAPVDEMGIYAQMEAYAKSRTAVNWTNLENTLLKKGPLEVGNFVLPSPLSWSFGPMDTNDPGYGYLGKLGKKDLPKELFWHEYCQADWPTLYAVNPPRPGGNLHQEDADVLLNVLVDMCENMPAPV